MSGGHLVHLQQDGQQVLAAGLPIKLLHAAVADEGRVQRAEVVACKRESDKKLCPERRWKPAACRAIAVGHAGD